MTPKYTLICLTNKVTHKDSILVVPRSPTAIIDTLRANCNDYTHYSAYAITPRAITPIRAKLNTINHAKKATKKTVQPKVETKPKAVIKAPDVSSKARARAKSYNV